MAKRKGSSGVRKRRVKATEQKSTSSAHNSSVPVDSNSTSIPKESPSDWLTSIQTDHITSDKNIEENVQTPLLLESIKNGLTRDSIAPKIQLGTSSQDDYEMQIDSIEEERSVDQAGNSTKNGLKPKRFYGSKLQSYEFSFQKSSKSKNETKVVNIKSKNEEKKEKCRSVKRKHKVPQDQESVNHVVKKAKKDTNITMKEKVFRSNKKTRKVNGVGHSSNRDAISNALEIKDKEEDRMNNNKNDATVLDIITPESSSSSSPMSEDPLCSVPVTNGITNGFHHFDNIDSKKNGRIIDPKISISDTKAVIDEVVSELGSLQSEDSITSGVGSVRAAYLLKGQNNEYHFSCSNETSPDLSVNGPSKFIETPKSSSASPDLDIESEDSCTKPSFLYYDKNASESSYSPSGSSSASRISPEHQTSITNFFKKSTKQNSTITSPKSKKPARANKRGKDRKKKMEQMYLDLGQRDFGHVTCTTCGMVYTHAQPDDEIEHIRHHKKFVNGLRFNGWKDERVVKEFHDGRIIMVKPDDHPSRLKKVEEIRKVVDSELGFAVDIPYRKNESKTFLFIANKRVVGCCVATQIDKGYPVLPSTPSKDSSPDRQIAAWCCSTVPVPAQCGISKIWVWNQYRRKKVATRLIDCVRSDFIYGCTIAKEVLAFSDPTPDGKRLASTYVGTQEFLVFR